MSNRYREGCYYFAPRRSRLSRSPKLSIVCAHRSREARIGIVRISRPRTLYGLPRQETSQSVITQTKTKLKRRTLRKRLGDLSPTITEYSDKRGPRSGRPSSKHGSLSLVVASSPTEAAHATSCVLPSHEAAADILENSLMESGVASSTEDLYRRFQRGDFASAIPSSPFRVYINSKCRRRFAAAECRSSRFSSLRRRQKEI